MACKIYALPLDSVHCFHPCHGELILLPLCYLLNCQIRKGMVHFTLLMQNLNTSSEYLHQALIIWKISDSSCNIRIIEVLNFDWPFRFQYFC